MNNNVYIHIPSSTIVRVMLAIVIVLSIFILRDIIILLLFAIVIAAAIDPLATRMENKHIPRIVALLTVYFTAIIGLAIFLWTILPPLASELTDFATNFSFYATGILNSLSRYGINPSNPAFGGFEVYFEEINTHIAQFIPTLPGIFTGVVGRSLQIITVFLASFYLALQRDGEEKFLRMLSQSEEPYVVDLWKRAQKKIGQWFQGQVVLAVLIGVATYVGLIAIGLFLGEQIHYALIIAIIAGILEIVPIVGPIATAIIAISIAFFQNPAMAILIGLFFFVLQQLEGNVLVPIIFKRVLGLHPIIVIFSLLIGARLGGIPGILLAVPVAAVLIEFFSDFSQGKVKV
ncbi:MAG: hypothetical protein A3A80_01915 [Candidatus Terrybacteria bacterium RIFCSPLOWO2_01_FULL_44_24]|uniref:AI-2E family transporter n=1 Tax=Candidatus Terrybacteria bacterium RIFCSPHIGHO2_01_FULL_43_35 TaxID=1802361 RepID=A0A1G2PG84_9BACT|nr:MAG: hypothetical protein A2828_01705 [Candidatus Terrybacteria bacterium RIFCSPHIGHO2_01_FULL_43_35]OHA50839.1 MAG: hypothetical protein A3A80_01915 [Candidatus Terrybacteria bacterium RIFCSPLOWO2_01_FULL_44_24]